MGLSVTLNPNGVGLQTALKSPLLTRDNLPLGAPNVLGGFVNAMGSMQGGGLLGNPVPKGGMNLGGSSLPAPPSSTTSMAMTSSSFGLAKGSVSSSGDADLAAKTVTITDPTVTSAIVSDASLSSISIRITNTSDISSTSSLAINTTAASSMEQCTDNSQMYRQVSPSNSKVFNSNNGGFQAVTLTNEGTVQGLTVRETQNSSLANSVILGVGMTARTLSEPLCQGNATKSAHFPPTTTSNTGNSGPAVKSQPVHSGSEVVLNGNSSNLPNNPTSSHISTHPNFLPTEIKNQDSSSKTRRNSRTLDIESPESEHSGSSLVPIIV